MASSEGQGLRLNIGCGHDIRPGWVNIDLSKENEPRVDVVVKLGQERLPYADGTVDEVLASHILEHIPNWEDVVLDVARVLKPGGIFEVRVPYGHLPIAYHVRTFLPYTLDYFIRQRIKDSKGLQEFGLFDLIELKINRRFPYQWHIRRYLKIQAPYNFPIGRKWEIVWKLRKVRART